MLILGIESSCDECCAAVIEDGRHICSNGIRSSAAIHEKYGGVVPEIASREHLLAVVPVIEEALSAAQCQLSDVEAIAVTAGPGLIGSLLVGVSAAKALAAASGKALVPVHHLAGHVAANYLAHPELKPPFLALLCSGAHSHIIHVKTYTKYCILARTRDDAAGEAFDKIAREIGLGYPGGPKIDSVSKMGRPDALELPRTHFKDSLDFSFSGLKTAVLNKVQQAEQKARREGRQREDILSTADIAASFQEAVCRVLIDHLGQIAEQCGEKQIVLAGGVSANSRLRELAGQLCEEKKLQLYLPPIALCTDNAAMIGAQGYYEYLAGTRADLRLNPRSQWELGTALLS